MSDREATQEFAIKSILINYYGQALSASVIDNIADDLKREIAKGPCAWAFETHESCAKQIRQQVGREINKVAVRRGHFLAIREVCQLEEE